MKMKWIKYIVERFTKGEKGYMKSSNDQRTNTNPSIAYKKVIRTIMSIEDTNKGQEDTTYRLIENYNRLYNNPSIVDSVIDRVRIQENTRTLSGLLRLRIAQLRNED
jgi:hypothetical protein